MKRRNFLKHAGIATALGLSGCLGSGSTDDDGGDRNNTDGTGKNDDPVPSGYKEKVKSYEVSLIETKVSGPKNSPLEFNIQLKDDEISPDSPAAFEFTLTNTGNSNISVLSGVPAPFGIVSAKYVKGNTPPERKTHESILLWSDSYAENDQVFVGGRGIMRHSIGLSTEIKPGETLSEKFTLHFDTRGLESGGYVIESGFENNATEEPRTYKTRFTIEPKSTERVKVETPAQCDTLPEFKSPEGTWNGFGYDLGNTGYSPEMRGPTDSVQVRWSYETESRLEASPAVSDDYVYFIDKQGIVYSLDKSNGEKVWDFSTGTREGGLEWSPMGASPTLVDDTLYIAFGDLAPSSPDAGREALLNGTDLFLYALDAETGKEKWKYEVPSVPNSTPKVVGGTAYFTTENGVVHAVDATKGEKTWEFSTGAGIRSTPAVGDCSVFVGGGENKKLYAIDAGDGSLKWEFKTDGELTASPAYRDGTVYFGSNGRGTLYAVDSSNGKEKWSKSLRGSVVRSSPAVTENQVFIGDFSRGVYALRRDDGEQLWRAPTRGYVWSSPAVTRDAVYCADLENMVFGLDRETGDELWSYETGDNVRSSPAVSNGVVYVAGTDGKLYAFSA